MLKVYSNLFKDGATGAVTMSFDDACVEDERLIQIFDRYSIKCTFNINGGRRHPNAIPLSRVANVYKNHEIACHGYNHMDPRVVTDTQFASDIFSDRQALESTTGRVIDGYAYPFGAYDQKCDKILSSLGIKYARTVEDTYKFQEIPLDFLKWHPTCHQSKAQDYVDAFRDMVTASPYTHRTMSLFYIWGHGFEFKTEADWSRIEKVCDSLSQIQNVWFATNSEIYEYVSAVRAVKYSVDNTLAYNPSRIDVWVSVIDPYIDCDCRKPIKVKIPAGQTVDLNLVYSQSNN